MVSLVCVEPDSLKEVWETVAPLIRASMKGALFGFDQVEQELFSDRAQLWIVWDGEAILCAGITQLYKKKRVCLLTACGGRDRGEWLHLAPGIEEFARAEGCTKMMVVGRKGWLRELKDYQLTQVILEKELT